MDVFASGAAAWLGEMFPVLKNKAAPQASERVPDQAFFMGFDRQRHMGQMGAEVSFTQVKSFGQLSESHRIGFKN